MVKSVAMIAMRLYAAIARPLTTVCTPDSHRQTGSSRRVRNWRIPVLAMAVGFPVVAFAMSDREAAELQTFNFMRAYYEQNNLKAALSYSAGPAQRTIAQELADIDKAGVPTGDLEPVVSIHERGTVRTGPATHVMRWFVSSSAGQSLDVETTASNVDGTWRVMKFEETSADED